MQEVLQATLHLFGSQLTLTPNSLLKRIGTVLCSPREERRLPLYLPPTWTLSIIVQQYLSQKYRPFESSPGFGTDQRHPEMKG